MVNSTVIYCVPLGRKHIVSEEILASVIKDQQLKKEDMQIHTYTRIE